MLARSCSACQNCWRHAAKPGRRNCNVNIVLTSKVALAWKLTHEGNTLWKCLQWISWDENWRIFGAGHFCVVYIFGFRMAMLNVTVFNLSVRLRSYRALLFDNNRTSNFVVKVETITKQTKEDFCFFAQLVFRDKVIILNSFRNCSDSVISSTLTSKKYVTHDAEQLSYTFFRNFAPCESTKFHKICRTITP